MASSRQSLFDLIPGYREAVAEEGRIRSLAFLDLPEVIRGRNGVIEVSPLRLRHIELLDAIQNPFVSGGRKTFLALCEFLWVVAQANRGETGWRLHWQRRRFFRRCVKAGITISAVDDYIAEAFMDATPSGPNAGIDYTSFIAGAVHLMGSRYGWSIAAIMDLPWKQFFQLLRCIDDKMVKFNPSDKVRGEWLRQQNETRN